MRDYRAADTIRLAFNTNSSTGAAVTMSSPTAKLYADGGTTEITTGLTVTTDFDGVTGAHLLTIDGATAGLVPGSTYRALVSATVSGVSVVAWVGAFTVLAQGGDIVSRGQLSAGGAGAFTLPGGQRDRVKVGDAIRIVSGTGYGYRPILTYNSTTGAGTVSAWDVNAVAGDYYEVVSLPNPEVLAATDFADGFLTSAKILDGALTAAKIASDAITAAKVASDVTTEIQSGLALASALTTAQTALTNIQSRLPAALVSGKMDASATVDTSGLATSTALATAQTAITDLQSRVPAALVSGKMDATATVDVSSITADIFAHAVESGLTFDSFCKLMGALYVGKTTGLTTTAPTFSSADISGGVVVGTKTRITATRDGDNNRLTLSFDLS